MNSSVKDTWTTPRTFFDDLTKEFNITLDSCALQDSALCDQWYGPDHPNENRRDGLTQDWFKDANGGVVWMNPPYGRGQTQEWLSKANSEALRGVEVLALVPSRTGALWFHKYCFPHKIRFVKRYLRFGDSVNPAPFYSALVHITGNPEQGYF